MASSGKKSKKNYSSKTVIVDANKYRILYLGIFRQALKIYALLMGFFRLNIVTRSSKHARMTADSERKPLFKRCWKIYYLLRRYALLVVLSAL
jgi:hypothetical protein